jgi:HNH endonuclease
MSNMLPFVGETRLAGATVNLDALISREDFSGEPERTGGSPRRTISLSDLESNGFFQHSLRKPDFQRETTHWSPKAVYEVVRAFLDGDLIPAVILWERGDLHFVIDGAHRLSALMAWARDDYGDGEASAAKFGGAITPEQKKIAVRTRALLRSEIGAYSEFRGLIGQKIPDPQKAKWVSRIGSGAIDIQWVTAATAKAAEDSFFKINQAAVPIDPTERKILQNRQSPTAIAARCISRAGSGHKYWAAFEKPIQEEIEALGSELHDALYKPPTAKQPVTTTDVPIAGQGYNSLPFVFELVSVASGIPLPTSPSSRSQSQKLPVDVDGSETVTQLRNVKKRVEIVSTNHPGSLGLHPLVYSYSSSGNFQPNAFLATIEFAQKLDANRKKKVFSDVRARFEEYLLANRQFVTLTMSRLGAGGRSLAKIVDLYWHIFIDMCDGVPDDGILARLVAREDFRHLKQLEVPPPSASEAPSAGGAANATKSASYISKAMSSVLRCSICGAAIHANSVTFDHMKRRAEGGDNRSDNLSPVHPFCNSGVKG